MYENYILKNTWKIIIFFKNKLMEKKKKKERRRRRRREEKRREEKEKKRLIALLKYGDLHYFYHRNKLDLFQPKGWLKKKNAETIAKNWGARISFISFIPRVIKTLGIFYSN